MEVYDDCSRCNGGHEELLILNIKRFVTAVAIAKNVGTIKTKPASGAHGCFHHSPWAPEFLAPGHSPLIPQHNLFQSRQHLTNIVIGNLIMDDHSKLVLPNFFHFNAFFKQVTNQRICI